jgi:hypothetical protein
MKASQSIKLKIQKPKSEILRNIDDCCLDFLIKVESIDHPLKPSVDAIKGLLWSHLRMKLFIERIYCDGFLYGDNAERAKKILSDLGEKV